MPRHENMKSPKEKLIFTQFSLSKTDKDLVALTAEKTGWGLSEVVRQAIRHYATVIDDLKEEIEAIKRETTQEDRERRGW